MQNRIIKSKLLLTTAVLFAGVSLASAQGMREGAGGGMGGGSVGGGGGVGAGASERAPSAGPSVGGHGGGAMHGSAGASRSGGMTVGQGAGARDSGRAERRTGGPAEHAARVQGQTTGQARASGRVEERGAGQSEHAQGRHEQTIGESRSGREQVGRSESRARASAATRQSQRHQENRANTANTTQGTTTGEGKGASTTAGQNTRTGQTTGAATSRSGTAQGQNSSVQTTGQAGATARTQSSAAVQTEAGRTVTAQQQSTIQRSVLSARDAPRVNVNAINFAVNPGVVVPSRFSVVSVAAYPALIDAFPYYRDDSFFIVEDEVVFLDRDRRVVDVVPVGPRTRFSHHSDSYAMELNPQQIREVQQVLIDRGLLVGEADGVMGSRTREALITLQRREGIATSGSVDTRTVAALGLQDRIGEGAGQEPSTVGQGGTRQRPAEQDTTGRATSPQSPSTSGQTGHQSSARQQGPQHNTMDQAAPRSQSTVGQASGNRSGAERDMPSRQPDQGNDPSSSGRDKGTQTPAQNSDRK